MSRVSICAAACQPAPNRPATVTSSRLISRIPSEVVAPTRYFWMTESWIIASGASSVRLNSVTSPT